MLGQKSVANWRKRQTWKQFELQINSFFVLLILKVVVEYYSMDNVLFSVDSGKDHFDFNAK